MFFFPLGDRRKCWKTFQLFAHDNNNNNIIITINILYSIPIGIFVPNRHEMIITRIIAVGIILPNFETVAGRVSTQREIDWATMTAVETTKMFPRERRLNNIIIYYLLLTVRYAKYYNNGRSLTPIGLDYDRGTPRRQPRTMSGL